jgi:prepilin-type processing-associated H-X9-DG protein
VRAAAAQAGCQNHLRQVALGLHHCHDVAGRLPAGMIGPGPGSPTPFLSWRAAVLPHLDQTPLWDAATAAYRAERDPFHGPRHTPRETPVPVLGCPADARLGTAWQVDLGGPHRTYRVALTSYLGVTGVDGRARNGVLFRNSRVRLADVTDGTSTTLLVGERPPGGTMRYGWWYAGAGQDDDGTLDAHLGARERNTAGTYYRGCQVGPYRFGRATLDAPCGDFHFWSLHPGGANFALCDGSVRFLPYSADAVLPALATRAGGEVAAPPD